MDKIRRRQQIIFSRAESVVALKLLQLRCSEYHKSEFNGRRFALELNYSDINCPMIYTRFCNLKKK
jgi:hypothetical protein